ncbi:MAG: enoyl-CoA hydratase [Chthoniobacterales bacterium]
MSYQNILCETRGPVGILILNRPERRNALSTALMREVVHALQGWEADDAIGAMILMGNDKAFAAGADIQEMQDQTFAALFLQDFPEGRGGAWTRVSAIRKPIIAAVSGYALGGGCELAMACDFIIAADNAKFGQPEVMIGAMPGAGGTQRLTRLIGKSKAMEMCLTGRFIDANEAERAGLVSRVIPLADLKEEAIRTATKIASLSRPSVMMIKDAVNAAYELPLTEGLRVERRSFQATFALEDQKEGMAAFLEKREPKFRNK